MPFSVWQAFSVSLARSSCSWILCLDVKCFQRKLLQQEEARSRFEAQAVSKLLAEELFCLPLSFLFSLNTVLLRQSVSVEKKQPLYVSKMSMLASFHRLSDHTMGSSSGSSKLGFPSCFPHRSTERSSLAPLPWSIGSTARGLSGLMRALLALT